MVNRQGRLMDIDLACFKYYTGISPKRETQPLKAHLEQQLDRDSISVPPLQKHIPLPLHQLA
jgi:hypothetical protein